MSNIAGYICLAVCIVIGIAGIVDWLFWTDRSDQSRIFVEKKSSRWYRVYERSGNSGWFFRQEIRAIDPESACARYIAEHSIRLKDTMDDGTLITRASNTVAAIPADENEPIMYLSHKEDLPFIFMV